MEEWKEYKISEIIEEIAMGPFGSNIKVDNFIDFGIPVLNGSNLQGFKLNEDSFNYVSEEKADSLGKANASRGDVVITHRGTLGQIVYIPLDSKYERYVISQSQFRLRLNQNIIRPDFFVYFFHTRIGQHQILMNASQVGVPALARPTSTFKEITIPVPPMEIQNRVMAILLSLDDKIELNHCINENLAQQAQALFKSWFVDFEPFQDGKFVNSELGMIPERWKAGNLEELVEVKYGKDHKKLASGTIPVYGSGGIMRYVDQYLYNEESVLIPRKGSLNNVMYVNHPFWTVDTMFYTHMKIEGIAKFIYLLISPKDLLSMNSGSAVPSMTVDILNKIAVIIPPTTILQQFESIVKPLFIMAESLQKENYRLAHLRDTLLPKLMSGELKINDLSI
jgi:type I restriction enzyme S subunit